MKYTAATKAGRCWNGAQRDRGSVVHAVPDFENLTFKDALCGAYPGRKSAGWARSDRPVSCPRCLKIIQEAGE